MALVAYSDDSDLSENEVDEENIPSVSKQTGPLGIDTIVDDEDDFPASTSSTLPNPSDIPTDNIFKMIPSAKSNDIAACPVISDETDVVDDVPTVKTWNIVKKMIGDVSLDVKKHTDNKRKKMKIMIPSLLEFDDDDTEYNTEPVTKKIKPSGCGTGLFSVLPSPKFSERKTISLVPESLKRKFKPTPVPVKKPTQLSEDSDEEPVGDMSDFFSLDDDSASAKSSVFNNASTPLTVDATPVIDEPIQPIVEIEEPTVTGAEQGPTPNPADNLDGADFLRFTGRRNKDEPIDIIDFHADDALLSREELELQALADKPTQSFAKKREGLPNSQSKRKHQITYLAHQAKAREQDLKNMWAQNRMTKRQTQAKYGF